MNLNTIQRKAQNLVEDLTMLQNGEWAPDDDDSIQASIDAAYMIKDAFPLIIELVEEMSAVLEWLRTGEVDGVHMDEGMILSSLETLNEKMTEAP